MEKKLVLAYSGGLDTSYCLKKLSKDGFEVHAVSVNTGGFNDQEIKNQQDNALKIGATKYTSLNGLDNYYNKVIRFLVFGNILKNETYPLSVSAERVIQAIELINYANKNNIKYIAHGSTGAGNDQIRFDLIFQTLAPDIKIITPIRDNSLTREEEINYLKQNGIDIPWEKGKYSINKGLWGTTIGGDETLHSNKTLPEIAFPNQLKEKKSKNISLSFNKGELVEVNGLADNPVNLINYLQSISEKFAIGRDTHVGDTIIGIKGRVAFEAAAPIIIIKSHHLLEKHTLSKWQQFQKKQVADFYGMLLHEGNYLDPVMRDIESFLISSQKNVTGKVSIKLSPYRFELEGISSNNDLMNNSLGVYGEMNNGWSSNDVKGFIKIISNTGKIFNLKNSNKK